MNIVIKDKQFFINGESKIILAGEIQYYRLEKKDWQSAIDGLKQAGFNTVATYIPWFCHEQKEGDFDLTGIYRPQYDIVAFMKLVYDNGLYFIARPGPFVMAEMINDGIPNWVSKKHPDCIPVTWDNQKASTVDLDYLEPGFLSESKKWYEQIITEIKKYEGKNLLAIQLDNEMGMLAWVSNCPCLTDSSIKLIAQYFIDKKLESKFDFDLTDIALCTQKFRSPDEDMIASFQYYLADFYREKIKIYTETLENWCKEFGIKDTPYLINVHGTGGGFLYGYPIGISQLYKTYQDKQNYIAGSDIYFDDLKVPNIHHTYLSTAITEATNQDHVPLASFEFDSVDNDFGFNHGNRTNARTNEHRARLLLAQGTKMFNFYLFTGGFNDYTNEPMNNGFDRIATTGEKHGYGAPIRPDGTKNFNYEHTKRFGVTISKLEKIIAPMHQVKDSVSLGFIPDYYKNEYIYPKSKAAAKIVDNIKSHSMDRANEVIVRYLLLRNYNPACINIQDKEIDFTKTKTLIIHSAKYMDYQTQNNICTFLKQGGKILIFGEVPEFDLESNPCTLIKDQLQLEIGTRLETNWATHHKVAVKPLINNLSLAQTFVDNATLINSKLNFEPLLGIYPHNEYCAILIESQVAIITTSYRCDMLFFDELFTMLECKPKVQIQTEYVGTYSTLMQDDNKNKILSIINMDDFDRTVSYKIEDKEFEIQLESLDVMFVPLDIKEKEYQIVFCNNEISSLDTDSATFRLSSSSFVCEIISELDISCNLDNVDIAKTKKGYLITYNERKYLETDLIISFKK